MESEGGVKGDGGMGKGRDGKVSIPPGVPVVPSTKHYENNELFKLLELLLDVRPFSSILMMMGFLSARCCCC
jgi:hypothetical protein